MTKPTIIMVPGAFHKPIHYTKIIENLQAKGYEVIPVTLKSSNDNFEDVNVNFSHFDDATEVIRNLQPLLDDGKEVVLFSHSYGSFPSTASTEGNTVIERKRKGLKGGIKAVISIAGFAFPARGKSITGSDEPDYKPFEYHELRDGVVILKANAIPVFYSDVAKEEAEAAYANCAKHQSLKTFITFPTYLESDIQCPKTYVQCEADQAVPFPWQEQMASVGGYEVVKLASGHSPFLTMPDEVVAIIEKSAQA